MDDLAKREIDPTEVGREQHDAALGVERPGSAHPDTDDLRARNLLPGLLDGALGQQDQPVQYIALAGLRGGRLATESVQRRAILGHAADDEVGTSDINSEDKSH